ncbi:MAG: hypothetical protein LBD14_02425 [Puniceicoccales bacterium]|nr:hypothetical protein [Puniceicoccales bacterium]
MSFPDGRVLVRDGNVRSRALAWVHHAQHAQSRRLRDRIFSKLDLRPCHVGGCAAPQAVRET